MRSPLGQLLRVAFIGAAALALPCFAQVQMKRTGDNVAIAIDGEPFTEFITSGAGVTKPYLHPLRAASGTYVTRMWPMADVPEEAKTSKDHQHQRGVWFAHDDVNGIDFWNNEATYKTPNRGRIALTKIEAAGGAKQGVIDAAFDWIDPAGKTLVTESRRMTFYAGTSGARIVDFDITLKAATAVRFNDSKDGVFGIRMRPELQEKGGTGHIVNSRGEAGEPAAWGRPADWCDYSGTIAGEGIGISILDHPANPHHPVRWHVRAYGLFAANPFGLAVFTGDKTQSGAIALAAGESLRFCYRVIVHAGDAQSAGIAEAWRKYATEQ
jgi:hypothetical protein